MDCEGESHTHTGYTQTKKRTEEEKNKMLSKRLMDGIERGAKEWRGVGGLTGSPSVLGLPPPSVYRCPAETEGTIELHTPPSPAHYPMYPNTVRLSLMDAPNVAPVAVLGIFLVI